MSDPVPPQDDQDDADPGPKFPIVAVGASAGWYEAMSELLQGLPAQPGCAIVLILHLDPRHKSQVVQVLARSTSLPIEEVTHDRRAEPDHVYVVPADALVTIAEDKFQLHPRDPSKGHQHIIDGFFRSLAEDRGASAVGVILSGTLSDGVLGLRDIRVAGGCTYAQSVDTALHREMPQSAIASGYVDKVLRPSEIGQEVGELTRRTADGTGQYGPEIDISPTLLDELLRALRNRTGADFSQYKRTTVRRRVLRRMAVHHKDRLVDYLALVRSDQAEAHALYEELLVHVTRFFRDDSAYKALTEIVLPEITRNRSPDQQVRVWVPGCASGEEAYSVAIIVSEFLQREGLAIPIQVFATDLSDRTLRIAREGHYPDSIADDVSADRLVRYFEKTEGGYRVNKTLRAKVVFALHNIATDPPFSNMDIVSCRNVLVYMESELQRRVLAAIHYALKPSGVLLLGTSESVGRSDDLFQALEKDRHVFYKKNVTPHVVHQLARPTPSVATIPPPPARVASSWNDTDLQREADRLMLDRFAPAGLVVNDDLEIVQFRGKVSPYIEPSPGPASFSLLKLAREGIAFEIRQAVQDAKSRQTSVRRTNVRFVDHAQRESFATIEVTPIAGPTPRDRYFLVLFLSAEKQGSRREQRKPSAFSQLFRSVGRHDRERVTDLERELAATREYLQSVIEEHEATTEELRSANEEAISSNEELQSTNEELETAKEELQSTNEELSTLNDELMQRNQEIQRVNNDLINLLNSVPQAIVMVGPDLRLRRFTPKAEQLLNLIPTDLGRPLTDIRHPFEDLDVRAELMRVLESFVPREVRTRDAGAQQYALHFHPYRTSDNRVDGVVLVITTLPS